MKRIVNRYTLVTYGNLEKRVLSRKERVESLYEDIRKYNSYKNNPYFIGDVVFNGRTRTLYYRRYCKLINSSSLRKIDEMTTRLENEESLKRYTNDTSDSKIFIAYRANKKVRLLRVFYKHDKDYLNEYYLESRMSKYSSDVKFLNNLLNNKLLESSIKHKEEYLSELSSLIMMVNRSYYDMIKIKLVDFFTKFIYPDGEKSYYNLRFLANIVREYERNLPKKVVTNFEEELPNQLILEEFLVGCLNSVYEEAKLGEVSLSKKLSISSYKTTK